MSRVRPPYSAPSSLAYPRVAHRVPCLAGTPVSIIEDGGHEHCRGRQEDRMSTDAADAKRAMTEDDARILNRLARIEGQVRGLQRMIEQGKDCEEILAQLAAVKSALDRVGTHLISHHMKDCLEDTDRGAARPGRPREGLRRLLQVRPVHALVDAGRSSQRSVSAGGCRVVLSARVRAARQAPAGWRPLRRCLRQRQRVREGDHRRRRGRAPAAPGTAPARPALGCPAARSRPLRAGDVPAGRARRAAPRRGRSRRAGPVRRLVLVRSASSITCSLGRAEQGQRRRSRPAGAALSP